MPRLPKTIGAQMVEGGCFGVDITKFVGCGGLGAIYEISTPDNDAHEIGTYHVLEGNFYYNRRCCGEYMNPREFRYWRYLCRECLERQGILW